MHWNLLVDSQFYYLLPFFVTALSCKVFPQHAFHGKIWHVSMHGTMKKIIVTPCPPLPSFSPLKSLEGHRSPVFQKSRPVGRTAFDCCSTFWASCKHSPFLRARICHYCHQQLSAINGCHNGQELYSDSRGPTQISLWTRKNKGHT